MESDKLDTSNDIVLTAYNNKVKLTETSFTISVFDALSLNSQVII